MESKDRPTRILIAEDDMPIAQLLSMQLEGEGYQVIHAVDGEIAWNLLQEGEPPDLVILDILMPNVDGFEVCRRIRSTPHFSALPVVFLTALQDSASRLRGLELGANDFLAKPWSRAELYARIRTLLRLKEAQDALRHQNRRLGLLYDISRELSAHLDLDQLLTLMMIRAGRIVEATGGSIVLMEGRSPKRKIRMNEQIETEVISPPTLTPVEKVVLSWLDKHHRPWLVDDLGGEASFQESAVHGSLVVTPLVRGQEMRGFLSLTHTQPGWFDNDQVELLDSLARQTIITIENTELFERVRQERQRFAALIASMDDGVIATDSAQKIILANPAAAQLLALEEEELRDQAVQDAIKDTALLALFNQVKVEDLPTSSEIVGGGEKIFYTTVSPVGVGGQVAVMKDISALKELQAVQLAAEQEKAARIRAIFNRYMSPELVNRALAEERGLMEKRERREAAVLFADLRGFTRLTLQFSADRVVSILNEFFTLMTSIAYSHHGTIFDIAGDELMVGFGVPFALEEPVGAAIGAAIEMQAVFAGYADKWWQAYGDKRLGMGVGIDYGTVVVGNVGSPTRMNYALVGLPVNTAHALVATAADGEIRFSEAVRQRYHPPDDAYSFTTITSVPLKGREEPQTVTVMTINRP